MIEKAEQRVWTVAAGGEDTGHNRPEPEVLHGDPGANIEDEIATDGVPSFWPFMALIAVLLAMYSLSFSNANTIAMDPMGKVAGMASAVIGTISIAGGALLGAVLDRFISDSVTPLVAGFAVSGAATLLMAVWAERGRLFRPIG